MLLSMYVHACVCAYACVYVCSLEADDLVVCASTLVSDTRVDIGMVIVEERSAFTVVPWECLASNVHV